METLPLAPIIKTVFIFISPNYDVILLYMLTKTQLSLLYNSNDKSANELFVTKFIIADNSYVNIAVLPQY